MNCKYCGKYSSAKNAIFCSKKCNSYYSSEIERKNNVKYSPLCLNMDQDVLAGLRSIQCALIKNTNESISLSQVVNLVLSEGIKIKKMSIKNT